MRTELRPMNILVRAGKKLWESVVLSGPELRRQGSSLKKRG